MVHGSQNAQTPSSKNGSVPTGQRKCTRITHRTGLHMAGHIGDMLWRADTHVACCDTRQHVVTRCETRLHAVTRCSTWLHAVTPCDVATRCATRLHTVPHCAKQRHAVTGDYTLRQVATRVTCCDRWIHALLCAHDHVRYMLSQVAIRCYAVTRRLTLPAVTHGYIMLCSYTLCTRLCALHAVTGG